MPESCASLKQKTARLLKQMLAPVKESEPLELLSSNDEDDYIPLLSLKELNNRVPSQSCPIRMYGVVSPRTLESPSSYVAVESRVCTTATQTPTSTNALVGDESSDIRIYDLIVAMGNKRNAKNDFRAADLGSFEHKNVKYFPSQFNGNAIFELPLLQAPKLGGKGRLEGMDRRYDGHCWTETATSNLSDNGAGLQFKYVKCLGQLHCMNETCPQLYRDGPMTPNKLYWEGSSPEIFVPGIDNGLSPIQEDSILLGKV